MKLSQSINSACCFELVLGTHLIKVTAKIKLVLKRDLFYDHLKYPKRLLITNRESPDLSLHTFKSVYRTTLETPWDKLQILPGMKLTTDVTLPLLLEVNNDISIFFISQVWTMKLTASTNFCYISDRNGRTVKVNIKETFMGNNGFL